MVEGTSNLSAQSSPNCTHDFSPMFDETPRLSSRPTTPPTYSNSWASHHQIWNAAIPIKKPGHYRQQLGGQRGGSRGPIKNKGGC